MKYWDTFVFTTGMENIVDIISFLDTLTCFGLSFYGVKVKLYKLCPLVESAGQIPNPARPLPTTVFFIMSIALSE